MTNLDKMNELVSNNADKETVKNWAYANRIWLCSLPDEDEFKNMENSVNAFIKTDFFQENMMGDERLVWDKFLDADYVN